MNTVVLAILLVLPSPLIDKLGSRHFRQREAAHRALAHLGRLSLPHVLQASKQHPSTEVRCRCHSLLIPFEDELAEATARRLLPPGLTRYPWLYLDNYEEANAWLSLAWRNGCNNKPPWDDYREACRLRVRMQILSRVPESEIAAELQRFHLAEVRWVRDNGLYYLPPLVSPLAR